MCLHNGKLFLVRRLASSWAPVLSLKIRAGQVEPGRVTMCIFFFFLFFIFFFCHRFGTRQDRKGFEAWHTRIIETHTVRRAKATTLWLRGWFIFLSSKVAVSRRATADTYANRPLFLIGISVFIALLLLYDITSKSSFDNIRVSLGRAHRPGEEWERAGQNK